MIEPIRTWREVTPEIFVQEIRPLGQPAVMKGLVTHWPAVANAQLSSQDFANYLAGMSGSVPIPYAMASPEIEGRFHYSHDLRHPNFEKAKLPLRDFLELLLQESGREQPMALAAQGLVISECLTGFADENHMPILPPTVAARLWIGNAAKVATHNDPSENIACVVAGRRRFTVFPPAQIGNLYIGPLHLTPAGTPVSMVHLTKPDLERYPRFAEALNAAQSAQLEPGDAIYLPYQWFHHVEALDPVSALVNYWWDTARTDLGSPWDAMLHGMMSLRGLPPEQRRAWRAAFDHYVFLENGNPCDHLPEYARGVLGADTPNDIQQMRQTLIKNLTSRG